MKTKAACEKINLPSKVTCNFKLYFENLLMKNFKDKANFLWSIADLLRGHYKQADYGKVILPFTVLRRLDLVFEPTKKSS